MKLTEFRWWIKFAPEVNKIRITLLDKLSYWNYFYFFSTFFNEFSFTLDIHSTFFSHISPKRFHKMKSFCNQFSISNWESKWKIQHMHFTYQKNTNFISSWHYFQKLEGVNWLMFCKIFWKCWLFLLWKCLKKIYCNIWWSIQWVWFKVPVSNWEQIDKSQWPASQCVDAAKRNRSDGQNLKIIFLCFNTCMVFCIIFSFCFYFPFVWKPHLLWQVTKHPPDFNYGCYRSGLGINQSWSRMFHVLLNAQGCHSSISHFSSFGNISAILIKGLNQKSLLGFVSVVGGFWFNGGQDVLIIQNSFSFVKNMKTER